MSKNGAKALRRDLAESFCEAEKNGQCLVARSESEAHRLRAAARRGLLVSPASRVYARPEQWDELGAAEKSLHVIRALSSLHPDWTFCHVSAALVHGLSVSNRLLGSAHVAARKDRSRAGRGVTRHAIRNDDLELVGGVRVTSLARTVLDCAREAGFRDALALVDSALRVSGLSKEELARRVRQVGRHVRGCERVCAIVELGDARAESGGESIARAVMYELGFMQPDLQVRVADEVDGGEPYRVDFAWELPGGGVVYGELDGREKYRNPSMTGGRDVVDVLADERLRESRMGVAGAKVMRFSFGDVVDKKRFAHLLRTYGIPEGYPVPDVVRKG